MEVILVAVIVFIAFSALLGSAATPGKRADRRYEKRLRKYNRRRRIVLW
jgi:hypothetical protein